VAAFTARNLPLHVLILNAGVFLPPHTKTQQGFEVRQNSALLARTTAYQWLCSARSAELIVAAAVY
jgi:hypothetical protein